jgi:hypothetical protein
VDASIDGAIDLEDGLDEADFFANSGAGTAEGEENNSSSSVTSFTSGVAGRGDSEAFLCPLSVELGV